MSKPSIGQLCELFRQIAEGRISSEVLQKLIEKGPKLFLTESLKKVSEQIRKVAANCGDHYWNHCWVAKASAAVAAVSGNPEDLEQARKAAAKVKDSPSNSSDWIPLLVLIATVSKDEKDFTRVYEAIEEKEAGYVREGAKEHFAKALAKIGDFNRARSLISEIGYYDMRADALITLAEFSGDSKDLEWARAVITFICDPDDRSATYRDLFRVSRDPADLKKARKAAAKIEAYDTRARADAFRAIAFISKKPKDFEEAVKEALKQKDDNDRLTSLGFIFNDLENAIE